MNALHALGLFVLGVAIISGAVAVAWPTLVEFRGYPRATLPGPYYANAYFGAPLFSLVGLTLIGYGFAAQPLVATGLLLVTLPAGYVAVRRAFQRTELKRREHPARGLHLTDQK